MRPRPNTFFRKSFPNSPASFFSGAAFLGQQTIIEQIKRPFGSANKILTVRNSRGDAWGVDSAKTIMEFQRTSPCQNRAPYISVALALVRVRPSRDPRPTARPRWSCTRTTPKLVPHHNGGEFIKNSDNTAGKTRLSDFKTHSGKT